MAKEQSKISEFFIQLSYLPRALRLVWEAARIWTLAWSVLLIIQGLLPVVVVYLTKPLVDSLHGVLGAGVSWETIQPVLIPAAFIAAAMLLREVLQGVTEWIRTAQSELIQDHISAWVHEKSLAVDLAFYESPEFFDHLHRARSDAGNRPLTLVENLGSLLQNGITLLAMAGILIPYGIWLPVVLFVSTLPAFYVIFRFNRRYHRWWEERTVDRRWAKYYDTILTYSEVAAEIRLFSLGDHFRSGYQSLRRRLRGEHIRLTRDQGLARMAAGTIGFVISGAAMGWMIWRAMLGLATLGDLGLFYQAFNQGQTLMRSLLSNIGQIYANSLFLSNLFEFLELRPQIVSPQKPLPLPAQPRQGIHFRQVTFCYPGSQRPALKDFDLSIPAGKTVAIVGANGAGKSTLIKLLCRFYDPEAGRIDIDGVDIRNFALEPLRRMITILFQSPVYYHATAWHNIAVGDLPSNPNAEEIEAAARGAGAHEIIQRLPDGYQTLLGKWFPGGTQLSGGEWQRIALARAFLRQAPIIILDEPTSFMDSWAEAEWLERFRTLVDGRTALIITHRFTTAMQADIIHVMAKGRIVETGTHTELLVRDGLYAQSWAAQTQSPQTVSGQLNNMCN